MFGRRGLLHSTSDALGMGRQGLGLADWSLLLAQELRKLLLQRQYARRSVVVPSLHHGLSYLAILLMFFIVSRSGLATPWDRSEEHSSKNRPRDFLRPVALSSALIASFSRLLRPACSWQKADM